MERTRRDFNAALKKGRDRRQMTDAKLKTFLACHLASVTRRRLSSLLGDERKVDFALLHLFERDARGFVSLCVEVNARSCAALQLLAALRRHDDHAVFGINHWLLRRLFVRLCCFSFNFRHIDYLVG